MATSTAFSTSNNYVKYMISVVEGTQDVINNNTKVTVTVHFYRTNTGYTTYGTGTVYCRIDGTLYSEKVTSDDRITAGGINLFSKTVTIPHNSDGTKSLSVTAWINHNAPLSSSEQGFTTALTTITRASQPSCVTFPQHTQDVGDFGDTISIHMNSLSAGNKHTVRYQFGSRSGTIATGVVNGTTWKIPLDLMNLIPSATKGSGTIYVDTYAASGAKIGTKYCGFTATVPTAGRPTCSIQVLDGTDTKDKYGSLIQGLSKLYIKTTPTLYYGAKIASYNVTADGKQYNTSILTTPTLSKSGTVTVSATVTDARGRTSAAASASFPVLAYEQPTVTRLTVHRCNSDGTENEQGEYVRVNFDAKITALNNKNSAVYVLRYKKTTDTAYTSVTMSALNGVYTVTDQQYIFAADGNSAYNVEIVATDDMGSVTMSTSVSTAFSLFNCHQSGTGWAFGKVSEKERTVENALDYRQMGNKYAYQPSAFGGEKGYTLLAAITVKELNANSPITFVLSKRGTLCPMNVYVRFASSSSTTDPELGSITYEGDNYGAFLVKVATSTWNLYVDNTSGWSNPCLQEWYTSDSNRARIDVAFPNEQISELPDPYYRATPAKMQSILDYVYPVGSIYLSYSHVDPSTMFGGTWVRIENAFLWATTETGTIGQTGGEATHKLTVSELPSHNHGSSYTHNGTGGAAKQYAWLPTGTGTAMGYDTHNTGGGQAHNNMPPYIQVSVWRRTA